MITYRPVDRERDFEFARQVHHAVYRDVVTRQFGSWNKEMQDRFFEEEWWASPFQHILRGGESVGLVSVGPKDDHRFIYELMVSPEFQGQGIGTLVLRDQIAEASRHSQPLQLKVLRMNKAKELYERMGFVAYDETDVFIHMKRHQGSHD